ncbi:SusC/RagA family TonB-linked outer membrane protein [Mucilaginibacter pocheonensis]|uniref:TonB-linked SusC/RagA family outer membrane protein n=1 Tax=Mucilaginibacter pocheonensis TaxID=398050 RepID=A0ABU1T889_9SPHI|nr:SusC/RagA family TonB-linked outer membrane protein [Mucilaginibacter pocheonensis]MDR6941441.1 TonB-linked SusC/RagA family outer membrane protein [Mucilaginibacter pocheonensis]
MKQLKLLFFIRKRLCPALLLLIFSVTVKAQVSPSDQYGFEKKRISIQAIVNTLKNKYGYKVSFEADLNMSAMVTLPDESLSFDKLTQVLQQQAGVGIKNIDGNLVIKKLNMVVVSGTVISADDKSPLGAVTVSDNAKKLLTFTNNEGKFSVLVASGSQVNFSTVGYATQSLSFNRATVGTTITLSKSNSTLNEVVVTALGIKRDEKALGYAATVIKNEQLTDALSSNWTDALSGKVAGLNLIRSNSGPTGSNKIILRGENNLTGDNEALIVLDGVVMNQGSGRRTGIAGEQVYGTGSDNMPADYGSSINDINPEDIESISVLKGPGAAALYGQRGANGAIIITTKSGNAKKKGVGITVNSNASIEKINRWPDLQFEYGQGTAGATYYSYGAGPDGSSTSGTSSAYGPRFDGQMFFQYDPVTQKQSTVRTPWVPYKNKIREFFDTGQTFTNSVSIDGGTDKTTARFSATNVSNKWITPNTGYGRNSVALSVNSKINDKLTISSKVNYQNKFSDNLPGAGYGNQSLMYWFIFWQPSADLDWLKNYWKLGQEGRAIQYPYSSFPENPYAITYEFINRSSRNAVTGNVQATYDITKALSLQLRTSLDMGYEQRAQERPYDAGTRYPKGSYRTQNIFSEEVSGDFLLRYNKAINKDVTITATAGGSMLKNTYRRDEVRADSLIYPGAYSMANTAGPLITLPYSSKYSLNSFYGLLSASYKNYLYLDLTGRQDWNSVLATPKRTDKVGFFYPSASASFILSDAFKLPETISFAKVRASASSVGSGTTVPYRTSFSYSSAGSTYPGGLINPTTLPDVNLEPLRTTTFEVGADVRFFKNRLGFDLALYSGITKNQILNRVIDASAGADHSIINIGKVNNRGIELVVNGSPVSSPKGLTWTTNVTFSANRNKIRELADSAVVLQTGPTGGGQIVAKVGGSMGDLYGRGYQRAPDGQVVFDPTTGVALISPNIVYLGNTSPKWKLGFNNDFKYKQFHFSILFDAQYGAVAYSLTSYKMAEQGKTKNTLPGRYNGIIGNGVVQNPDGTYRKNDVVAADIDQYYQSNFGANNAEGATYSTNFIKLREARFDYSLPARLVSRIGIQRATIGVYGRDLFIWTKWPGFDPEFGTLNGSDITQGFEIGQFPSARTMGVNLVISL